MSEEGKGEERRPTNMLVFVKDPANIVTLLGLCFSVTALYFCGRGIIPAALIAMQWALLMDWYDGPIARNTRGRSESYRLVGIQLDSLADLISSGVCPAMLLLVVSDFDPRFLAGALLVMVCGTLRLAYFNIWGLDNQAHYLGMPIDTNIIVLGLVFLLQPYLVPQLFALLLLAVVVICALLHVSSLPFPKLGGKWHYIITAYVLVLTVIYARGL